MAFSHFADASRVASGRARISTLNAFAGAAVNLMRSLLHRRAVSRLGDLDDRMLDDIGVTRFDVRTAMAQPLWDDPSRTLANHVRKRSYLRSN